MKVEAVTLREIQMPLVHPFETSFEKTTHRRILLVTVHFKCPEESRSETTFPLRLLPR